MGPRFLHVTPRSGERRSGFISVFAGWSWGWRSGLTRGVCSRNASGSRECSSCFSTRGGFFCLNGSCVMKWSQASWSCSVWSDVLPLLFFYFIFILNAENVPGSWVRVPRSVGVIGLRGGMLTTLVRLFWFQENDFLPSHKELIIVLSGRILLQN